MSTENPFAPPGDSGGNYSSAGQLVRATQGKRFLTYIVDAIFMYIVNFGLGIILGLVMLSTNPTPQELASVNLIGTLIGLVALFIYYFIFEVAFNKTIGKMVCGTKVVSRDGGPPSIGQVLGRTLCRFIPFEFISFFLGDSSRPTGWHDSIPGTLVIEA